VDEQTDRFKDRFENDPDTDDVEGHRLKDKDDPELAELDRNADPDVEAHRLVDRNMDRNIDRNIDRNVDRNKD
jgi:hypothetical protein